MRKEVRTVCFDEYLSVETISFEGIVQQFPNHFHDYYVIGLVLRGMRKMRCKNRVLEIDGGDAILLNPADSHGCVQTDGGVFDYISLNISENIMRKLAAEITGESEVPVFSENVIRSADISELIVKLHNLILTEGNVFEREETLLLLLSDILESYGQSFLRIVSKNDSEVERVCRFIDEHYYERLGLDELCAVGHMSKSALLRSFAKFKGITPYRYLQSVRINRAKELLEQKTPPIEAAALTGFSDQSHFSNAFHTFFGLSPSQYGKIHDSEG